MRWSNYSPIFARICQELARTNGATCASTSIGVSSTSTSTWKWYLSTAQVPVQVPSTAALLVRMIGDNIGLMCYWNHTWSSSAQVLMAITSHPTTLHLQSHPCLVCCTFTPSLYYFNL